jgi:hypothetical protein
MSRDWKGSRDNSVGIAMGYRLDDPVRFQAWKRDYSVYDSVHTCSGAHPVSYTMDPGVYFLRRKNKGRGVKLTTHFHLVPNGARPPLPLTSLWRGFIKE